LYNVAEKDIGRKLKCKKCGTSLKVTSAGLEVDSGGTGSAPPVNETKPASAVAEDADVQEEDADEERASKKKKKEKDKDRDRDRDRDRDQGERGPGFNPAAALNAIGGISTLLFGFGVFLVIVFTAFPIIGAAGTDRAEAYVEKLIIERDMKIKEKEPKKKQSEWSADDLKAFAEAKDKIDEDYRKQIAEAAVDAERTSIANRRDVWFERYGLMFGFIFVAFGSIGYLRTEQPLVLKIVAAVVLAFMMVTMFLAFGGSGGGGGKGPSGGTKGGIPGKGPGPAGPGGGFGPGGPIEK
jgi:hypothetical protein